MLVKFYLLLAFSGLSHATESYIIGGEIVQEEGKWPWMGSLRVRGSHSCGISLISSEWGVTAAHCVKDTDIKDFSFMFGSNNRWFPNVIVAAKTVIQHKDYNVGEGISPNDIAVVSFDTSVTGDNIEPVPLAPKGSEHSGNEDCWITGWGQIASDSGLPIDLREAHVNVYTQKYCKSIWGDSSIYDGQVCIGDKENGRTSCSGDSGGPLVCKVNGRYELVGATSWGITGCKTTHPAGYTRMAYFRDWIKQNTGI